MMKEEFEKLAGYEVSYDNYHNVIEPMYAAVDINKQEFVKLINKKAFALKTKAQYLKEMKQLASILKAGCSSAYDSETRDKFAALLDEYKVRFHLSYAYTESKELGRSCCYYPYELVTSEEEVRLCD